LREAHVTELVGPSSSGKTQLCLQAASNFAKKYSGMVVYFESGNSVSPKRMAQLLSPSSNPANPEIQNVNQILEQLMSSIVHYSVFDIYTLLDLLHRLLHGLKSQMCCQVRMLIIDSLPSFISPVLGGGGAHGACAALSLGFNMLSEFNAYGGPNNTNDCCQVTNHMVAGEAGASKPALGESWKNISHVRLLLFRYMHVANPSCISLLGWCDGTIIIISSSRLI
ncbi:LOW QUALITY PROTEIN: DNA repair protein RAD51 homolog 4, partial [Primulina huaijiensis]|uniref:LOW QUALITY PROTEIN: DNA repair protein RAD51 homolog 4 n=1 Tax=Primulina huaijiensis TaxID=1492673 RepID=UPI003CC703C4